METLFVAHRAPYPPDKGDRLRAWRHVGRLSRLGPVDLVAQADSADEARVAATGLGDLCREVFVFPRTRPLALLRVALALAAGRSLTTGWHSDARVEATLRDLETRHAYGLCWAFSSGTGPWLLRRRTRRRIMDLCDLDALKWEALAQDARGLRRWVWRLEARRLLPLEIALAERADACLVSSEQEARDLRARGRPRRLEVLTNGAPWQDLAGLPPPSGAGPILGFLGQMDYRPNVRAAAHLAQEVLPRVRERIPGAVLRILGRAPSAEVRALASESVEVRGEVASVREALAGLRVFCAPLDRGRGIPNKILEALAAGRATLVSSWAARALAGEAGVHYLVADDAAGQAARITELLRNDARCDALGRSGAAYVREHHDWEAVLDRLERLAREVADA